MHAQPKPRATCAHAMRAPAMHFALGATIAALVASVPLRAQGVDPCTVYTCMAGVSGMGATGGPACAPALAFWHGALAVYSPLFNPPASAIRRASYLRTCRGANYAGNTAVLNAIIAAWGWVP